ncbi:beta-1,3-galactosyl-O-glycosyl-glycoprotein beta-1,6-N-acetylglucosaminyltransferase 4-like isoform X2 [Thalassophryne amazonica]|uniref:beta-1,3-galactosyl-O-glycosyl-glycoprotein beta-1,6-N-acetylglucosaminyltransferase 4-like isoform X2 n=1 Tax=Thalassophryne amazonica TaxID=390379 RepID=UPI0014723E50|nr:beta-1,3-galactosyl-O-glycosyl-glycoprotein beta-1,6-N-acetylglucosaminyltransferase 4-like isoform X2 [Thalassophryne amazonica]
MKVSPLYCVARKNVHYAEVERRQHPRREDYSSTRRRLKRARVPEGFRTRVTSSFELFRLQTLSVFGWMRRALRACWRVTSSGLLRMNRRCVKARTNKCVTSVASLLTLCVLLLVSLKLSYLREPLPSSTVLNVIHTINKYAINCAAINDMDPVEVGKSLIIRARHIVEDTDTSLVHLTSNCSLFIQSRGYDHVCLSKEERNFPLAYSLVVHKSAWMVERLIKALYSPSNIYCVHYDQKSSATFISAMEGLARCLPNVFIASKLESVFYASISRLKADLNCLSDLLNSEVKWKYVINLCGQDFPLKPNIELVAELRKLKGANMLETSRPSMLKQKRFRFHYELKNTIYEYQKLPVRTKQVKTSPPHGIKVFIGNAYFVLSRDFVKYVNSSVVVADFLSWSEDTYSPDEHFWATLVRLPGVPGKVPASQPDITDLMSKTRLVKWEYLEGELYPPCTGTHVRSVCIYGAAELRWLRNYGHWFANKFDPKVDPIIIQCLEEKLQEKQRLFQSAAGTTCD